MSALRLLALVPGILLMTACAGGGGGLGGLGDILGTLGGMGTGTGAGGQTGQIRAEIDRVDTGGQRIYVRTQTGESGSVRFDDQTQVIYQQQQYPVTALERGDVVTIQAQQLSGNELYAQQVYVEQSVQDRSGGVGGSASQQARQMEGRVGQIDYQRGMFELQTQSYGTVLVSLPYNPPVNTADRFNRLRTGESVRVEGEMISSDRLQLTRFP